MTDIIRSAARTRKILKKLGYPYSDEIELHPSNKTLDAEGGQYGIEIPVITSLDILKRTIELLKREGVDRAVLCETIGSFLLSQSEKNEMLHLCREEGFGMFFSSGPRPEYDRKSTFYRSDFGLEQGRRLNNNEAIVHAVEEVISLSEQGCRGFIIYDIGVLSIVNDLRKRGIISSDVLFSTSTHCMISNSMIAKIYSDYGANHIIILHDVGLPVLQEMRKCLPDIIVMVLPIDVYKTKGGFIRFNELAEIVQIASPVFLKMGASAQSHPHDKVSDDIIAKRIERIVVGLEHLRRTGITFKLIPKESKYWGIPSFDKRNKVE